MKKLFTADDIAEMIINKLKRERREAMCRRAKRSYSTVGKYQDRTRKITPEVAKNLGFEVAKSEIVNDRIVRFYEKAKDCEL